MVGKLQYQCPFDGASYSTIAATDARTRLGPDYQHSSAAGVNPAPGMGVYSTTKAAVLNLTVTMAQVMDDDGVTINTVSPGAILTPSMVEMAQSQGMGETPQEVEAAMSQMMSSVPFRRMGRVDEVADVVVFLASPRASYIHGANIRVDGGYIPTIN